MEEDKTFKCSSCVKENNEKINAQRFIDKLDSYFATNDLDGRKNIYFIGNKKHEI